MNKPKYRVIQWGTGRVGMPTLRGILERQDFELVGLYVSSAAKEGRDAGEICGAPKRSGVLATRNREALIAMPADCVCYTSTDVGRVPQVIDDLCALLESGKNVVNTSITLLVHPREYDQVTVQRLQQACERGQSTLYTTGTKNRVANVDPKSPPMNVFVGEQTTNVPERVLFNRPLQPVPFGKVIYEDLTFRPGVVTFNLFGHEVEFLPRALVLNKREVPWHSGDSIRLTAAQKPAEPPRPPKGGYP